MIFQEMGSVARPVFALRAAQVCRMLCLLFQGSLPPSLRCSVPRRLPCGGCAHWLLRHRGFCWLRPTGSQGWRWRSGESEVGRLIPWRGNGCVPLLSEGHSPCGVAWPTALAALITTPPCFLFTVRGGKGPLGLGAPGCFSTRTGFHCRHPFMQLASVALSLVILAGTLDGQTR